MKKIEKKVKIGGREVTLTTGHLVLQADSAVRAQMGETVVLAIVTSSDLKEDRGYFPLSVEYQEKLYAGGRIKGSRWVKRDGRPSDEEILVSRVIDRSIRPLFPNEIKKEVQVVVMVMSVDGENDPRDLAPIAASAAIENSSLPWAGPVSILRIGHKDGKFSTNPVNEDKETSDLDLVVSVTKESVVMIEAGAQEVSEETILGGIDHAVKESKGIFKVFADFAKEVGNKKEGVEKHVFDSDLEKQVKKLVGNKFEEIIKTHKGQKGTWVDLDALKDAVAENVGEEQAGEALEIVEKLFKKSVRELILSGKRVDGRKHTDIRPLTSEVGVLPRTHGTGLFTRGNTQVMTVATLGSPQMSQLLESAEGEEEKRYIHHYSMPPYSTGETGRIGSPGRREIGHGALAERALIPVLPSQAEFPYTIQLNSEVLSSNGSTSMASTCGSTLALMDAGVPISAPVSGIAMGLVIEGKNVAILSDIMGIEDFNGDMDFKVTGTTKGVTAMQMDVKTLALTPAILKKAIAQAKEGRAFILKNMTDTISEPRKEISSFAPKIISIKIDPEKIGEVIGQGGKTIKGIIADTGAEVNVEDDGTVSISGVNAESVERAKTTVENLVKEVQAGEIYEGTVARMQPFGAFVEILPGKDGLVHVSDMSEGFVKDPRDVVKEGDKVTVRVKEIDQMGRINLSMLLDPASDEKKQEEKNQRRNDRNDRGGDRGRSDRGFGRNDRGGNRNDRSRSNDRNGGRRNFGGRNDRRGPRDSRDRGDGPHFPASRLISQDKRR